MDVKVSKSELVKALSFTQSIVEKKTTMPVLANILLTVNEQGLRLSATDLEVTASALAPAEVKSNGSTTVNARIFADVVRELPEGDVHFIISDGERLEIRSQRLKMRMIGVSAEEYPSLPGMSFQVKTRVERLQLLEMVQKTYYAVSLDETRFNLNGVQFELVGSGKKKSLRLVATDGHRLAMITRPLGNMSLTESVIVPRKGLAEVKKLLDSSTEEEVGISFQEGFFVVELGATKISMRLIDGEFPDYKQVLPNDEGVAVGISGNEFAQALRRVALMITDKGKCVKLDFMKDKVRISSSSPELGDAVEEVEVKYAGDPLSVGFNAKYLQDFIGSLGDEQELSLELHGELGPGKLMSQADDSYIGIVMPMRLN